MIWGRTGWRPEQAHRAHWEATVGKQMKDHDAQAGQVAEETPRRQTEGSLGGEIHGYGAGRGSRGGQLAAQVPSSRDRMDDSVATRRRCPGEDQTRGEDPEINSDMLNSRCWSRQAGGWLTQARVQRKFRLETVVSRVVGARFPRRESRLKAEKPGAIPTALQLLCEDTTTGLTEEQGLLKG